MKNHVAAALVLFLFMAGCAGIRWEDADISENRHFLVRLQNQMENGRVAEKGYRHPVDLEEREIAFLLGELSYMEPSRVMGDPRETPIFGEEEIDRLVPVLDRAFKTVNSDQRIALTSFNTGGGLVFKKQRRTDGVIFMDNAGLLNIAFSGINVEVPVDEIGTAGKELHGDPLTIKTSRTPIAPAPGYMQPVFQKSGEPYPMWKVIDIAGMKHAMATTPRETTTVSEEFVDPGTGAENYRDIRSRLEFLKELYDDGLISTSEYEEKRREWIDSMN